MTIRVIGLLLLFGSAAARGQQPPPEWTTGTFTYDGAGNITVMGADTFVYDTAGRLVKGTADQQRSGASNRQEYSYDAFGNRLSMTRFGADCVSGCPNVRVTVGGSTNRITDHAATYDAAGNMTALDGGIYTYDGAGMLGRQTNSTQTIDWQYIYTADDERMATYTGGGNWQFTVRDLDGKVLRELTASEVFGSTTWTWGKDHVYRDGLLLATASPSGQQQFHLDHLGNPRLVTDGSGQQIGIHSYYPFGDELALTPTEIPVQRLKYTAHERDESSSVRTLDYMHARFYSPTVARFLTIDRLTGTPSRPQSWNRYTYALNDPLKFTDPSGDYFEWAPGLGNANKKFIRSALVAAIRTSQGRAAFLTVANDSRKVMLNVAALNDPKDVGRARLAIRSHTGTIPPLIFGTTAGPGAPNSISGRWTITFDRASIAEFAQYTHDPGRRIDAGGVTTGGHELFHQSRIFTRDPDWANETMAQAFGESIYSAKRDASAATADALFNLGFTNPNLEGSLGTLFNADSFWVEGIQLSFAYTFRGARY